MGYLSLNKLLLPMMEPLKEIRENLIYNVAAFNIVLMYYHELLPRRVCRLSILLDARTE